ncbi:MAG: hypothetical protein JSR31_05885 [Nitrospira sp.]|nr:hypothetical protein [Nitrospira sp.]
MQRTYAIGGSGYVMPDGLSWQQNKWLGEHVFQEIDLQRLDYGTVHDLLREKGPLLMAICLVETGKTRAEHSRMTWAAISERADLFAAELSGEEVALFGPHFFQSCQPGSMAMLMPGRQIQALVEAVPPPSSAPGADGSSGASSRSATETSPSSDASLPSGGLLTPSPISNAASSDRSSTAPSLGGSASSSPG